MKPLTCKGQGYPHKNPKCNEVQEAWSQNEARAWNLPTYIIPIILRELVLRTWPPSQTPLYLKHMYCIFYWKKALNKYSPASEHHRKVWVGRASQLPALLRLKESPKTTTRKFHEILPRSYFQFQQFDNTQLSGKVANEERAELLIELKIIITSSHHKSLESCNYSK